MKGQTKPSLTGGQDGQEEVEGEALAGGAFGGEFALVGMDGFAGEKQFEADFFAGPPVVERIKNFFQGIGLETMAVVLDGEMDVVAGGQGGVGQQGRGRLRAARLGLHGDRPAGGIEQAVEAVEEVARRLGILPEAGTRDLKGPELMQ